MSEDGFAITKQGYDEVVKELNDILTIRRPAVIDRIREARQLGDLSENFDYDDAKRSQAMLEARIKELKVILSHSKVVEELHDGSIGIGSKVIIKDIDEGYEDEYIIVGPAESNPSEGKISLESCVGEALFGKKVLCNYETSKSSNN
jgi:transcription elongation factor GreA